MCLCDMTFFAAPAHNGKIINDMTKKIFILRGNYLTKKN